MVWTRLRTLITWCLLGGGLLATGPVSAQTGTLTGTVSDAATGTPLPGANVFIVGTTIGSSTNADGRCTIDDVEPGTYTLRASFVRYRADERQNVTVEAGEATEVDFILEAGTEIEELVVVDYGEQRREDLTTSVSSISDEDIADRSLTNPAEALQGTVPGLVVTQNSGSPGSGFSVRIWGVASPGNNDPLYVVDGGPLPDRPDYLNPSDIEFIDVIKYAAGAAIYGTQGSNEVILITKKKGSAGEARVDFSAQYGVWDVLRQIDMLEAAEYATLRNGAAIDAEQSPVFENPTSFRGQSTTWQDEIFQTGTFQKYSLGISGGGENYRIRVSGDFTDETGIVKTSDNRQVNFRVNAEYTTESGLLTVGENLSIGRNSRNTVPEGSNVRNFLIQTLQFSPTEPVRDPSLNTTDNYTFSRFGNNAFNPVAALDFNNSEDLAMHLVGNVFADLEPIAGLTLKTDFGLDLRYGDNYSFTPTFEVSPEFTNAINSVSRLTDRRSSLVWTNTAEYNRLIGSRHDPTVLGGASGEWNAYEFISANTTGLSNNDSSLRYLQQGTEEQGAMDDLDRSRLVLYFGRVNYNFDSRYLVTLVGRYDGSSRFGSNRRFGFFPSFSLGWRLSEESFMDGVGVVDNLKLRGGYGINGNDAVGNFLFLTGIEGFRNYTLGTDADVFPGATVAGSGNPDLQWEESRQTNIGLDALGSSTGGSPESACAGQSGYELFFEDNFNGPDEEFWDAGVATFNGNLAPFRPENIFYDDGKMIFTLKEEQFNGKPYTGAELRTDNDTGFYSHGCYEVRMKSAGPSGTVSSFFAFRFNPWKAIDIEIVGKNNNSMLTNIYFNEGPKGAENNDPFQVPPFPRAIGRPYDASQEFNTYAFEWVPVKIKWYRDGELVKQATVKGASPSEIPDLQMQIMMNLWGSNSPSFAGEVDDSNFPVRSEYDWVRFYRPTLRSFFSRACGIAYGRAHSNTTGPAGMRCTYASCRDCCTCRASVLSLQRPVGPAVLHHALRGGHPSCPRGSLIFTTNTCKTNDDSFCYTL